MSALVASSKTSLGSFLRLKDRLLDKSTYISETDWYRSVSFLAVALMTTFSKAWGTDEFSAMTEGRGF